VSPSPRGVGGGGGCHLCNESFAPYLHIFAIAHLPLPADTPSLAPPAAPSVILCCQLPARDFGLLAYQISEISLTSVTETLYLCTDLDPWIRTLTFKMPTSFLLLFSRCRYFNIDLQRKHVIEKLKKTAEKKSWFNLLSCSVMDEVWIITDPDLDPRDPKTYGFWSAEHWLTVVCILPVLIFSTIASYFSPFSVRRISVLVVFLYQDSRYWAIISACWQAKPAFIWHLRQPTPSPPDNSSGDEFHFCFCMNSNRGISCCTPVFSWGGYSVRKGHCTGIHARTTSIVFLLT
jgi:hypothetical protein